MLTERTTAEHGLSADSCHCFLHPHPRNDFSRPERSAGVANASFHRMTRLRTSLEPLGCTLLPLPPYSPDLNKIESLWHRIKSFVRHDHTPNRDFHTKVNAAFCSL